MLELSLYPQTQPTSPLLVVLETLSAVAAQITDAGVSARHLRELETLAEWVESRDPFMLGHSGRVSALSVAMGRMLGLGADDLDVVQIGALLHDIGKVGVSDALLRKPRKLLPVELEAVRRHATLGARILDMMPAFAACLSIVELHHEQPDGRGYPYGLRGEEIPLAARLVHVADAFDAMTSARAYRSGGQPSTAIAELWAHRDSEFDRIAVETLIGVLPAPAR